ncbi:hypothetical protein Lqui_2422 [Legionella quinlivanii]|uniref:Relaxosome protein TraM n=1 Tax=Legionella quinlivanii TaxID=45073 RepID=A0A0W0XS80_9GAMM|nr:MULTISPECIES: hypothetical protein [Legionella]KTD47496.1 hypothetical protein Lqui_2422 [Legionella quinlivanii]MCE3043701.1 hypothetical protein [Legionella sp. 16cNR16C]SEG49340.1 hypothetical protein SAMN02746093_03145 [Legionella quinlivanii DSM 21216]STY49817.1 Uncharacterised protein [Legionella quinlivanii]
MEITIDLGEDTIDSLNKISKIKGNAFSTAAAEMVSFGARIYLQSLEQSKEDSTTKLLLENSIRSNEILTELLHIVYDKNKSKIGAFDADTALALIERMVSNFRKGVS